MRTLAYVSGGSNLDVELNLRRAAQALQEAYPGTRFSHCYRNQTVGFDGPDFVNFAAEVPVANGLAALRAELKRIESLCGRPAHAPRWAPRAMDLDILLFGDTVQEAADLRLPRPDLLRWAFMLGPLAEIAPDVMHPTARQTLGALWQAFDQNAHPLVRVALDLNS
jgi:2-amino-4-hydroxy-6-hydroxymethyldihydropteridine diphosphokinase